MRRRCDAGSGRLDRLRTSAWTGLLPLALMALGCGEAAPDDLGGGGSAGDGGAAMGAGGSAAGGSGEGGLGEGGAGEGGGGSGGSPYDGELVCDGPGARFATDVVEVSYGPGQSYGQDFMPEIALGPPDGGGCCAGSLDVVSLGNGGWVVVGFEGNGIEDGPGVDFVVFENAFEAAGNIFAEVATVEVSDDGATWHTFPCEATEAPWGSCAGVAPVYLTAADVAPDGTFDPATAGGDGFDLADVGVARARWVRITDRADLTGFEGVFDLDAVGIVNAACP